MKHWFQTVAFATALIVTPVMAFAETIRVTLQLPESHSLGVNWLDFAKIVDEKSGGELKIQLFPSAQLFKDKEVPSAVGSGAVEAGSAFIGRFAGSVPAVDVVSIPFVFGDEAHIRAAVAPGSQLRKTIDSAILKETNNKILWWQAFGRNIYLNNGSAIVHTCGYHRQKGAYLRKGSWMDHSGVGRRANPDVRFKAVPCLSAGCC